VNNNLQEWATAGGTLSASLVVSSFSGSPTTFNGPSALGIDPVTGNIYVADQNNSQFEVFSSSGSYLASFGQTELSGDPAKGVAVNSSGTTVFALDRQDHVVRSYSIGGSPGSPTYTYQSGSDIGSGSLIYPWNVVLDSSNQVYVTDVNFSEVVKFSLAGAVLKTFTADLQTPVDVAVDNSGNVFALNSGTNGYVVEYDSSGTELGTFGTFTNPQGICQDPVSGNLFITDLTNNRILVFTKN
jgi:hypothetical protein